ncbi:MAG: hypothetical protein ACLQEI_18300 [Terriglobales bacterium]
MSELRHDRKQAFASMMHAGEVAQWTGVLKHIVTSSDGTAKLTVRLSCKTKPRISKQVVVATDNFEDDNITFHSSEGLPRGTPLYSTLIKLSEGSQLVFSGTVVTRESGDDYIYEFSLTERGSMTDPDVEFLFKAFALDQSARSASIPEKPAVVTKLRQTKRVMEADDSDSVGNATRKAPEPSPPLPKVAAGEDSSPLGNHITMRKFRECAGHWDLAECQTAKVSDMDYLQDLLWIADHIGLDFGNDRGPSTGWVARGTMQQQMNKFTITKISLYCTTNPGAKKPNGDPDREYLDYGVSVRSCENQEIAAYKKIITGNAPRSVIENCTNSGYYWTELCVEAALR